MLKWFQTHVWMCTYIIAALAILTFLFNFVVKRIKKNGITRERRKVNMKISHISNSSINQSAGDMTVNNNSNATK